MTYPIIIFEQGDVELIQCSLLRIRILYKGKYQGYRKFFTQAISYCYAEGLL